MWDDPVKLCLVYKKYGCAHVDGLYCQVITCSILKKYNMEILRTQKILKIKNKIK